MVTDFWSSFSGATTRAYSVLLMMSEKRKKQQAVIEDGEKERERVKYQSSK